MGGGKRSAGALCPRTGKSYAVGNGVLRLLRLWRCRGPTYDRESNSVAKRGQTRATVSAYLLGRILPTRSAMAALFPRHSRRWLKYHCLTTLVLVAVVAGRSRAVLSRVTWHVGSTSRVRLRSLTPGRTFLGRPLPKVRISILVRRSAMNVCAQVEPLLPADRSISLHVPLSGLGPLRAIGSATAVTAPKATTRVSICPDRSDTCDARGATRSRYVDASPALL
jgi:hypothetical protein